eukprot:3927-Heterococcus_DN1.PRE.1
MVAIVAIYLLLLLLLLLLSFLSSLLISEPLDVLLAQVGASRDRAARARAEAETVFDEFKAALSADGRTLNKWKK